MKKGKVLCQPQWKLHGKECPQKHPIQMRCDWYNKFH